MAAGVVVATQSVEEFGGWMRTIDEKNQSVQQAIARALEAKDFPRAQSASIKVAETCTPCHRLHRPLP